jgi:hypothetical protein
VKVSVVCASDRPDSLPLLYWSLVAQTHKDWELLVMDQSYHGNVDVNIDRMEDNRIQYYRGLREGDWGQTIKELAATSVATGDALMFPADDAYYLPTALATMAGYIGQGHKLVICGWLYDKMNYSPMPPHLAQGYIDVGGFMVSTELFRQVGWRDKSQTGDFTLISDLAKAAGSYISHSGVLYVKN